MITLTEEDILFEKAKVAKMDVYTLYRYRDKYFFCYAIWMVCTEEIIRKERILEDELTKVQHLFNLNY